MREILFRGKRVDNGEWVEGDLTSYPDGTRQISFFPFGANSHPMVIPFTVGQFTGLLDKNGTRIFEGDVVRVWPLGFNPERKSNTGGDAPFTAMVEWRLQPEHVDKDLYAHGSPFLEWRCWPFYSSYRSMEVIGNIHDNPELLEANNANASK